MSGAANTSDQVGRNLMDHPFLLAWARTDEPLGDFRGPGHHGRHRESARRSLPRPARVVPDRHRQLGLPDPRVPGLRRRRGRLRRPAVRERAAPTGGPRRPAPADARLPARAAARPRQPGHDQASRLHRRPRAPPAGDPLRLGRLHPPGRGRGLRVRRRSGSRSSGPTTSRRTTGRTGRWPRTSSSPGTTAPTARSAPVTCAAPTGWATTRTSSVVDPDQRSWDHRNLFLVGAGSMPTIGTSNPTLTLAALACRTAAVLVEELA